MEHQGEGSCPCEGQMPVMPLWLQENNHNSLTDGGQEYTTKGGQTHIQTDRQPGIPISPYPSSRGDDRPHTESSSLAAVRRGTSNKNGICKEYIQHSRQCYVIHESFHNNHIVLYKVGGS